VSDRRQVTEVLSLAAMLAVRSRTGRRQLEPSLAAGLAMRLRRGQVLPEQWEQLRASELRNGAKPEEVPPFDEAVDGVLRGTWFPRAPHVLRVGLIPEGHNALFALLRGRPWELMTTDSAATGGFICSDSPLVWGDLDQAVLGSQPTVTDPDGEVTFPVSKDVALVSYPGARESNCGATEEIVAHINMRTLQLTGGLVFHSQPEFLLMRQTGEVASSSSYFDHVDDAAARRRLGVGGVSVVALERRLSRFVYLAVTSSS
jgi:hypothetical protein